MNNKPYKYKDKPLTHYIAQEIISKRVKCQRLFRP